MQNPEKPENFQNPDFPVRIARRAVRMVIFIGMFAVVLVMINVYVLLTQITATAEITRQLHKTDERVRVLEQALEK